MLAFPVRQNLRRVGGSFLVNMLAHLGSQLGGDHNMVIVFSVPGGLLENFFFRIGVDDCLAVEADIAAAEGFHSRFLSRNGATSTYRERIVSIYRMSIVLRFHPSTNPCALTSCEYCVIFHNISGVFRTYKLRRQ